MTKNQLVAKIKAITKNGSISIADLQADHSVQHNEIGYGQICALIEVYEQSRCEVYIYNTGNDEEIGTYYVDYVELGKPILGQIYQQLKNYTPDED